MDDEPQDIAELVERFANDIADGIPDAPWPPVYAHPVPGAPMTLRLPTDLEDQLTRWITAGYPHETCGLLVGRPVGDGAEVARVLQAGNLNTNRAHDRYELDPEDFLAADLEQVVG